MEFLQKLIDFAKEKTKILLMVFLSSCAVVYFHGDFEHIKWVYVIRTISGTCLLIAILSGAWPTILKYGQIKFLHRDQKKLVAIIYQNKGVFEFSDETTKMLTKELEHKRLLVNDMSYSGSPHCCRLNAWVSDLIRRFPSALK